MESIDEHELRTNPSDAVDAAAAGQTVIVTRHGHPVARLGPVDGIPRSRLRVTGLARAPRRRVADLPAPLTGLNLSTRLSQLRDGERL